MRLILLLCIALASSITFAAICDREVIYLAQDHQDDLNDGTVSGSARYSQYLVASYLKKHPEQIVFLEGNHQDLNERWLKHPGTANYQNEWRATFPNGLPAEFWELSEDQAVKLATGDGAAFSFVMGYAKELRKTVVDKELEDKYVDQAKSYFKAHPDQHLTTMPRDSYWYKVAFERRERLALAEINQYFTNNPTQRSVVLVFGSAHDFFQHADLFPSQCIKIPPDFHNFYLRYHQLNQLNGPEVVR